MHPAVPAHHDDDDRGAHRNVSDCAGDRRGGRRATAARIGGGGRSAIFAIHHAVHYSSDLPLFGSRGAWVREHSVVAAAQSAGSGSRFGGRLAVSILASTFMALVSQRETRSSRVQAYCPVVS